MSGDHAGKLGFETEDIGLVAAAKPMHLLSWYRVSPEQYRVLGNKHDSQASQMHLC